MKESDGKTYESGQSREVLYEAGGMTIDYAYEDLGIPAPFIFELRDTVSGSFVSLGKNFRVITVSYYPDGISSQLLQSFKPLF